MEVIDLSDTILPFALLQITNCLKHLAPGQAVEVIGLDAGGLHDLRCILPSTGHDISTRDVPTGGNANFIVRIRKLVDSPLPGALPFFQ